MARNRAFACDDLPPDLYHDLMDAGFRRSGTFIYQPICAGCRACQPIRVPVKTFEMSKSQRRIWRRNADLVVTVEEAGWTSEKYELYLKYIRFRHGREEQSVEGFIDFLCTSPVETLEFHYHLPGGKLVGVGLLDWCRRSLSSVYFYFDPDHSRRGLGVFSTLYEIDFARRNGIPHYYLGYYVRGCQAMEYKSRFAPHELLSPEGHWLK